MCHSKLATLASAGRMTLAPLQASLVSEVGVEHPGAAPEQGVLEDGLVLVGARQQRPLQQHPLFVRDRLRRGGPLHWRLLIQVQPRRGAFLLAQFLAHLPHLIHPRVLDFAESFGLYSEKLRGQAVDQEQERSHVGSRSHEVAPGALCNVGVLRLGVQPDQQQFLRRHAAVPQCAPRGATQPLPSLPDGVVLRLRGASDL
mmetsp:Transcript_86615/g.244078  ORF Transcript_86615/g.244078 Transcript_86615/m.244078 type:complete len:200 (+) Transcript_86615:1464-2063(+)